MKFIVLYISSIMENSTTVKMSHKDFEVLRDLGSGSFGKVTLVKKLDSELLYAMKTVALNRLSQKEKDSALN